MTKKPEPDRVPDHAGVAIQDSIVDECNQKLDLLRVRAHVLEQTILRITTHHTIATVEKYRVSRDAAVAAKALYDPLMDQIAEITQRRQAAKRRACELSRQKVYKRW